MTDYSNSFKKLISTSGINFFFRLFGLSTSFISSLVITRFFGVVTFGNYSLVFAISQLVSLFFTLGIPNTLIKIIGNKNLDIYEAKALLKKGIKAVLLFSIIPIIIFYFGANFISLSIFGTTDLISYFLIVSFSIPLFIVHELFLYFFMANKKFMLYNLFMFVIPNGLFLLCLFFFYQLNLSNPYTFLAFSVAITTTVLYETATVFDLKPKKTYTSITTKELLKTASPLLFSGLFIYLLNYSNVIMLGILTDEAQVGIYNIAYKIGSIGFLIIVTISTIVTPKMASLYGHGNLADFKKLTHNATRLIAVLSTPIVLILIIFSKIILSFWGPEVVAGSTTLVIVSIGVLFSAMAGNVDQILNMTNNQNILRNITLISFFINLGLSYLLIPLYGIEGAAFSSLLTNILINVLCLYYIKKKLGFYTLF
jgi:O-antigen/teichoic acid export membrane protein